MKAIPHSFRSLAAAALLAICAAWLAGCASDPADVEDRSIGESPSLESPPPAVRAATPPPGGSYRVVRGDTLYSIAFKRGLDYRDVAAWNGIAAPEYKILVGQDIRFSPPGGQVPAPARPVTVASAAPVSSPPPAHVAAPAAAPSAPARDTGMFEDVPNSPPPAAVESTTAPPPPAAAPRETAPAPASTAIAATPVATPTVAPPPSKPVVESPPPAKPVNDSATSSVAGIAWRWPSGGKMIGTYVAGDQTKQGVDIAGSAGDPVLASADGEVVYSGNGLLGYGELIIVKHNASFLSAYGHNRKRLVAEGDKVRAGQQIAEMGSSASSRDELHFEIRKNGKPVNPLDYLPPR